MNTTKIRDEVSVGAQPTQADVQQLARDGFKTVINLRVENEEEGQLNPIDEAQMVRGEGMEYLHIPVISSQIREGQVDEFHDALDSLPKPVFVHCAKGKRAGILSLMDQARREKWSGKETLSRAKQMGWEITDASLEKFVKEYVDSRRK
jgi:uncharacterized protein (TIGR01244 family)